MSEGQRRPDSELPSRSELCGSDPGFTGELTTDEYIRSIRGGGEDKRIAELERQLVEAQGQNRRLMSDPLSELTRSHGDICECKDATQAIETWKQEVFYPQGRRIEELERQLAEAKRVEEKYAADQLRLMDRLVELEGKGEAEPEQSTMELAPMPGVTVVSVDTLFDEHGNRLRRE